MADDDIEARLRRALAARADLAPPPGPVEQRTLAAVGGGQRRPPGWTSWHSTSLRAVAVAASVLAVVGAAAGGVTVARDLTHHRPSATHVSTPSVPSSPSVPDRPSTSSAGATPRTGPVPKDFAATDLTFVSADVGWALGTTPSCAKAPCTSLVRTTDGGRNWAGIAPPVVDLATAGGCTSSTCVSGVRFANASVGYLFGAKTMYLTTDGGANWTRQVGGAIRLEIADGNVLRVTTTEPGCTSSCTYRVEMSAVGSTTWRPAFSVGARASTTSVQLVRSNGATALQVYGFDHAGGRAVSSALYTSNDDGTTWTSRGQPCASSSGPSGATAEELAIASGGVSMTVLCRPGGSGRNPFVATSTNSGATFVPGTPHANLSGPIAAASPSTILANVAATGQARGQLLKSSDGGKTWAVVAAAVSSTFGGYAFGFLGFENATTGRWVSSLDPYVVWTTTDAGANWSRESFR